MVSLMCSQIPETNNVLTTSQGSMCLNTIVESDLEQEALELPNHIDEIIAIKLSVPNYADEVIN